MNMGRAFEMLDDIHEDPSMAEDIPAHLTTCELSFVIRQVQKWW